MRLVQLLVRALVPAVLALVVLFSSGAPARAGLAPYTEPGKIDFDTAMGLLNPYGTWAQIDGKWAWTPLDHAVPYTNGRWLYSEYGWFWKGNTPTSWITEHYGYWKRGADKVWAWYPGPDWLPQTVELRSSSDGIGWRSGEVDRDGNFVEAPSDRFTKIDEWTFVTPAQFAGPITPAIVANGDVTERLLEESTDSLHSYLAYRLIERPGPHPANFINLGDGGMFAPMTDQERQAALHPKTPVQPESPAPNDGGPPDDPRQVKYWVIMCLPTRWAPPPVESNLNELYIYRPDFYQDHDGIQRRIALWLNPSLRSTEAFQLQNVLGHAQAHAAPGASGPAAAAVPAEPAGSPFVSPFEEPTPVTEGTKASDKPAPASPVSASTNAAPAVVPAGRATP
jgi:hypothetical protein